MKFREIVKQRAFRSPQAEAALNLVHTANLLDQITREELKPYGVSSEQYNVLRILKGKHPDAYALQEIQDRMLNRWSNVSRLVDKLKQKGYLIRRPKESNRRKVEIKITDEGLDLLDELENVSVAGNLFDRTLSAEEANQLSTLLDKFRNNLQHARNEG